MLRRVPNDGRTVLIDIVVLAVGERGDVVLGRLQIFLVIIDHDVFGAEVAEELAAILVGAGALGTRGIVLADHAFHALHGLGPRAAAEFVQFRLFLEFSLELLVQHLDDLGDRPNQVEMAIRRVYAEHAVMGERLQVELDGFLGDQVDRDSVGAERVDIDGLVIVFASPTWRELVFLLKGRVIVARLLRLAHAQARVIRQHWE